MIDEKKLIKDILQHEDALKDANYVYKNGYETRGKEIIDIIERQPTVEAVPVVRCKDCKHSDLPAVLTRKYGKTGTLTCHNRYGSCNNRNVNENDFCSAGELPEQT